MSNTYTRWYRIGSVALTKGSTAVVGTGTYWSTAGLNAGDMLTLDNGQSFLEIASITDDTHLTLANTYTGDTLKELAYAIVRNFTSGTLTKYAAAAADILTDFRKYVDMDLERITGQSAYELAVKSGYSGTLEQWLTSLTAYGVAVANGYKGIQAEWLESLKAAGEWATLDARTNILTCNCAEMRNSLFRGKYLGTAPTPQQYAAIRNGNFKDLWLGDYWSNNGIVYRIAHFNYYKNIEQWQGTDPDTGEKRKCNGQSDLYFNPNHVIVVPDRLTGELPYYVQGDQNEDGTWPGYINCSWYKNYRSAAIDKFASCFGYEHLLEWKDLVPSGYNNSGKYTGRIDVIQRCEIMTYDQFTGRKRERYDDLQDMNLGRFALYNVYHPRYQNCHFRDITSAWGSNIYATQFLGGGIYDGFTAWTGAVTANQVYAMIGSLSATADSTITTTKS